MLLQEIQVAGQKGASGLLGKLRSRCHPRSTRALCCSTYSRGDHKDGPVHDESSAVPAEALNQLQVRKVSAKRQPEYGKGSVSTEFLVHRCRLSRKDKAGAHGGGRSCRGEGDLEQNQTAPTWRMRCRRRNVTRRDTPTAAKAVQKGPRQTHQEWTSLQASPSWQGLCWSSNGPAVPRQACCLSLRQRAVRTEPPPTKLPAGDASPALPPVSAAG